MDPLTVASLSVSGTLRVLDSRNEHQQTGPYLHGAYSALVSFPLKPHHAVAASWFLPAGILWVCGYGGHM